MLLLIRLLLLTFVFISLGHTFYSLILLVAVGGSLSKVAMFFAGSSTIVLLGYLANRNGLYNEKDK
jgi:hypothetical protein